MFNRLSNCKNRFQGDYKKVLCVCSAGLLRSPTAALVLSQEPFNYNTRACGITQEFALIPIDIVLLDWADEVVVMDSNMADIIKSKTDKPIINLNIEDIYEYRNPILIDLIKNKYTERSNV